MNLQTVLAICFSSKRETFHHWKVFSSGPSGACIEFDKELLLRSFAYLKGFRSKEVTYRLVKDVEKKKPQMDTWPFLKRKPFEDEGEFRIIYESRTDTARIKHVSIDLHCIRRITLSPWMPDSIATSVIGVLRTIPHCRNMDVYRSSLLENSRWRKAID